ncbi:MAG: aminoacyl--tRNA ligase-related protein [Nanoarchaeota archaeon]
MECLNDKGEIFYKEFKNYEKGWEKVAVDAKLIREDPVSEKGHETFLPRGAVLREILYNYLYSMHVEEDAFFMRTPLLCDYSNDAVKNHAELSGEGIYHTLSSGNDLILKHGTLFTQLQLMSAKPLKLNSLPLKIFEIADCHRMEEETNLLCRTRQFSMIDMHIILRDINDCKDEAKRINEKILGIFSALGLELEAEYTVEAELLKDKEFLKSLITQQGEPVWLKRSDGSKKRPINVEYYSAGIEVAAFQIDGGNPEKFGLELEDGQRPLIMHVSFAGSIERLIYALMKKAVSEERLPEWLAPEQARIISERPQEVQEMAAKLKQRGMRVTIDDRNIHNDKKSELAKKALVPLLIQHKNNEFFMDGQLIEDLYGFLLNRISEYKVPATFPVRLSRWPEAFRV